MRWISSQWTAGTLARRCWVAGVAVGALLFLLLLLPLLSGGAAAQVTAFHRDVIVLDPAHGGTDTGAQISDGLPEKDVTMQLAERLRSLLAARGFTVIVTRDGSTATAMPSDQRADVANRAHAVACVVLHASASGRGVHLGTSTIGSALARVPAATTETGRGGLGAVPWDRAQEVYLPQSLQLASKFEAALSRSNVPVTAERTALRPLDNLMCPAISLEVSPQGSGGDTIPVNDAGYQQRIADAVAGALIFWRNQAEQPVYIPLPRPSSEPAKPSLPQTRGAGSGL